MSGKIENKIGELVYKKIEELQNFQGDLKELSPESYEKLKTSFIRHGNIAPIFIWDDNILDGHQRINTLFKLRDEGVVIPKELPCVKIEAESEKEAKRFLLQYISQQGRVTEDGLYAFLDEADLQNELEELKLELDLPSLDLKEFEEEYFNGPSDKDKEDEAPGVPREARSKEGDLYELGEHRVLCGDATKKEDVEMLMAGQNVELILSDPPYCSGGFQESGKPAGSVGTDAPHKQIANDRLSTRGYSALLKTAFGNIDAPFIYTFTDWRMWVYLFDIIDSSGFGVRSMIVWDKGTPGMGRGWRAQHELIMWGCKTVAPFDKHAPGQGNVISEARTGNKYHTTEKPVALLGKLLNNTPFAKTVTDPFLGSGPTLIACEKTNRKCYGMELDPLYVDVTVQRYVDYTQNRAIKLNGREITWGDI